MLLHLLSFALLNRAWIAAAPTQSMSTPPDDTSEEMIGWVSPDARRNTWGIIWSCLTIFIVCSWKCVHLNVPRHNEAIAGWHKIKLCSGIEISYWPEKPRLWKWTRKLFWMALIAVAPEYGVGVALAQYFQAKNDLEEANPPKTSVPINGPHFSLAHAFYVQMGGIIVCDISPVSPAEEIKFASTPWRFVSKIEFITSLSQLNTPRLVPKITEEDIGDLGKSDAFTKIFALLQCTWLVVQSIARAAQGHAISQLELATLSFIPCALAMYILWWQKPFGVERRHILLRLPEEMNNLPAGFTFSIDDLLKAEPGKKLLKLRRKDSGLDLFLALMIMDLDHSDKPTDVEATETYIAERTDATRGTSTGLTENTSSLTEPIATPPDGTPNNNGRPTHAELVNRAAEETTNAKKPEALFRKGLRPVLPPTVLYFTAVVFTAIHLAAWNWNFPSNLARELWRWFALAALLTSAVAAVLGGITTLLEKGPLKDTPPWIDNVVYGAYGFSAAAMFFFYTVARLVILGLTLYSLSSMPERAYEKVSWMAWIPHFS